MSDCFDHMCEAMDGRWDDSDQEPRQRGVNNYVPRMRADYSSYVSSLVKKEVVAETQKAILVTGAFLLGNAEFELEERWLPKSQLYTEGSITYIRGWLVKQILLEQENENT